MGDEVRPDTDRLSAMVNGWKRPPADNVLIEVAQSHGSIENCAARQGYDILAMDAFTGWYELMALKEQQLQLFAFMGALRATMPDPFAHTNRR